MLMFFGLLLSAGVAAATATGSDVPLVEVAELGVSCTDHCRLQKRVCEEDPTAGYEPLPCSASLSFARLPCRCRDTLPKPTPAPPSTLPKPTPAPSGTLPKPTPALPSSKALFGTGLSGGNISVVEQDLFSWTVDDGHYGVMTHFWMTAPPGVSEKVLVRYYIDGEENASIQFLPPLACGTALNASQDSRAPWGTKWFGKGAKDGAWFHNFRVPFQSIRVTIQSLQGSSGGVYFIVRGMRDLPVNVGGVEVPVAKKNARLQLQILNQQVQPLDYVHVADVPSGKAGVLFLHTLAVQTGNLNFLEGCYHAYTPRDEAFPGTIVSTGTEDYFDSAWYFNAGEFTMPVSGFTHNEALGKDRLSWSAYRFHEMDPLVFQDGFRFVWRNGDAIDPITKIKCTTEKGGSTVGSPTESDVTSYAWVYVWDGDSSSSDAGEDASEGTQHLI